MPWFRIDDAFHSHPKVRKSGLEAVGLWSISGAYCMSYLTDGFVPGWFIESWPRGRRLAKKLVESGLWFETVQDGEKGWSFHEWGERQPSKDQVVSEREASRIRKAKSRQESRRDTGCDSGRESHPPQPNPYLKEIKRLAHPASPKRDIDADFEAWWSYYPRKISKGQAESAYRKARKLVDAETLTAGVKAYAKTVAGKDREYVAYGSTWLNGKRWLDENIAPASADGIQAWLRTCWENHDTAAIFERCGLEFQPPDPPDDLNGQTVREFTLAARRAWIETNRDTITARILAKESAA